MYEVECSAWYVPVLRKEGYDAAKVLIMALWAHCCMLDLCAGCD